MVIDRFLIILMFFYSQRGLYPQKKKKPKPRIKFIPPPPTVKPKERVVEEKAEVLYKFSVKTGGQPNAGTNANVNCFTYLKLNFFFFC